MRIPYRSIASPVSVTSSACDSRLTVIVVVVVVMPVAVVVLGVRGIVLAMGVTVVVSIVRAGPALTGCLFRGVPPRVAGARFSAIAAVTVVAPRHHRQHRDQQPR